MTQIYDVYYPDSNVRQQKVLINHADWLVVKAIKDEDEYKTALRKLTGGKEWFTEKSPIYDAIDTGKLLLYNGTYSPCEVKEVG